jgi:hypothetical protein
MIGAHSTGSVTLEDIGLVVIAASAVAGWAAWWFLSRLAERRRRAALAAYAASRGWSFVAEDDAWAAMADGEPFGDGHDRQARYIMRGRYDSLRSVVFDYRWTTGVGKHETQHRAGVYALTVPVALPRVHIRPERMTDMAARLFGGQDIDLESEDFNRAFRVRADDARFAYDLLNPRTMEILLSVQGLVVQVSDRWVIATSEGGLDLEPVDYVLALLAGMVERLPDFVWTDRGARPPSARKRPA